MPSQFLLICKYSVKPGQDEALATALSESDESRLYIALDGAKVVELRALDAGLYLSSLTAMTMPVAQRVAAHLIGDVRRELLDFVEEPKDVSTLLPETPYIQLRHVEVKPDAMEGYRQWREETIFDVVRGAKEIGMQMCSATTPHSRLEVVESRMKRRRNDAARAPFCLFRC